MSIPLERLYHYIKTLAERTWQDSVVVYFFYPHGSKNIENLIQHSDLLSQYEKFLCPEIYCNDQEPLDYAQYQNITVAQNPDIVRILKNKNIKFPSFNLRGEIYSIWDQAIILHSEQRSSDVDLYRATQFIPVYYWSHAVIALDWFRYARHVVQHKQVCKTFLIYNRAWSGTREYRLKFSELLIRLELEPRCQTSVNPIEPELGIHYKTHKFKNLAWRPQTVLENYFPLNTSASHYSADFDIGDYEATDIEVVLETLFDDSRLHLTEKSLRPIACAQPFIVAGTHGSLEYLRSYGFKTFSDIWDESYDQVKDPEERLIRIADLMKQIANWAPEVRQTNMTQARIIAKYNQQLFFSTEFFNQICNELETNLTTAFAELENTNTSEYYLIRRKIFLADPELERLSRKHKTKEISDLMLEKALEYSTKHSG
jgi:hypothetical protein